MATSVRKTSGIIPETVPATNKNQLHPNTITMTALFILAIAVFLYIVYVLLKPEKF
ncbi:hypothetical protein FIC_01126 [Flavobacteriaceae bacterium 3519-10]|nr:hypothetical protein FIC_01126 [Flavobacteriaceae bacterium 3519-10]